MTLSFSAFNPWQQALYRAFQPHTAPDNTQETEATKPLHNQSIPANQLNEADSNLGTDQLAAENKLLIAGMQQDEPPKKPINAVAATQIEVFRNELATALNESFQAQQTKQTALTDRLAAVTIEFDETRGSQLKTAARAYALRGQQLNRQLKGFLNESDAPGNLVSNRNQAKLKSENLAVQARHERLSTQQTDSHVITLQQQLSQASMINGNVNVIADRFDQGNIQAENNYTVAKLAVDLNPSLQIQLSRLAGLD